ncbi:MAG: phage integrase SAM-like domain-containing protein [Bacteroidetes bacterium]|nr:phage integrase SAM-like domain-containing protein [Bacteroidota bacterium]
MCSYKNITSVLKRLKEYMNNKELLFSDIDEDFIEKYKTHLIKGSVSKEGKKIPGLGNNTISYQQKYPCNFFIGR